jgi:hypothetical protein
MAKIKSHTSDSHKTKPKNVNKKTFERVYWPYIPMVIAVSVLLVLTSSTGALKNAVHHPLGKVLSYSSSMSIGGLLADTNTQRSANGVGSLSLNSKLDAAAQANADDMAARDYWSHNTPDGNPPWIWVSNQGYAYQKLGQNLATGFSSEQTTIDGWMASPPHRENLLDPSFTEVGFGYANVPDYTAAGGGPQTVVVAFYGDPQVLAASTTAPAPAAPTQSTPAASSTPAPSPPAASQPSTPPADTNAPSAKDQPATTKTPAKNTVASASTSNLSLAVPSAGWTPTAAKLSILLALSIFLWWANKHIRALHRFILKGERYALGHPLTDLGMLMIGALLFILSQTAGLIQ